MSALEKIKEANSLTGLAGLLGVRANNLSYILYKLDGNEKYIQFSIPKRSGGCRQINAPIDGLKRIQSRLADILYECVDEIRKEQQNPSKPLSHGFKRKEKIDSEKGGYIRYGIFSNARQHRNKRYVVNLDLEDFFPSFNFGRVRGYFLKNKNFELHPKVATLVAQIACYNNELPQGSPCSPIISNLITHILDVRLAQWAKKNNCFYSRYADDITFSTNLKDIPKSLATFSNIDEQWKVGEKIEQIIERSGFFVNVKKTRLHFRTSRQLVTGLVVNKKVNVKSEYYRSARAMCHKLFKDNEFFLPNKRDEETKIAQLEGILNYIYSTKVPTNIKEDKSSKPNRDWQGIRKLYRNFLYFRDFIALERPLIICEGFTDVIHLKTAIKQLKKKNEFTLPFAVSFFKHMRRINGVMGINSNGAAGLKNFVTHYVQNVEFTKISPKHLVIVIFDNDQGMKESGILSLLSKTHKNRGKEFDKNKNLHFVCRNLFVLIIPKVKDECGEEKDTAIEDLYSSEILDFKLGGKKFSRKKIDTETEYSKTIFAKKVIVKKQNSIDFSGFQPLLNLIVEAKKQYDTKQSVATS